MKIALRVAEGKKKKDQFIEGAYFQQTKPNVFIVLMPVPEWANDAKCKNCGKPARFLVENYEFLCGGCLTKRLGNAELKVRKVLGFPSIDRAIRSTIFEWSPNDGKSWYRVKGSKIECNSNLRISKEEVTKRFHKRVEQILMGTPQDFEASYDKDEKKLTVEI